jgi:hypothetical protein
LLFIIMSKYISNPCPLCSSPEPQLFHEDQLRRYLFCPECDLVFAHPDSYLSREEEFKRYELHENNPEDGGYRSFLEKLYKPMIQHIPGKSAGLDFGSGPGPLLKMMFEEQGHKMAIYDAYYARDESVFQLQYDFITSTEVVEHLHHPLEELDRLWSCLKPSGTLGIMTGIRLPESDFSSWHYILDETHVIFFSLKTFAWLAERWGAKLEFVGKTVVLFQKS